LRQGQKEGVFFRSIRVHRLPGTVFALSTPRKPRRRSVRGGRGGGAGRGGFQWDLGRARPGAAGWGAWENDIYIHRTTLWSWGGTGGGDVVQAGLANSVPHDRRVQGAGLLGRGLRPSRPGGAAVRITRPGIGRRSSGPKGRGRRQARGPGRPEVFPRPGRGRGPARGMGGGKQGAVSPAGETGGQGGLVPFVPGAGNPAGRSKQRPHPAAKKNPPGIRVTLKPGAWLKKP